MGNKFAIYVRVSRTDQVLENQKLPLIRYAERMGWEYEIFEEKESTRKTRPVQWALYNRLLKKEFDGVLFYKLDRWARSLRELVTHMTELYEKGINVVSYTENIDLSTATGRLMMNIMGSFAEFERSIIRERTLAGLERAKAQGKKLGRPKGKSVKKDAPIEVVKNYLGQGYNIREIAKVMETSKYRVEKALKKIEEEKQRGFSANGVLSD